MKAKDRKVHRSGQSQARTQEEILSSNFPDIKDMGWLMAEAVDDIYALEDGDE
jgi:hypothetical protein